MLALALAHVASLLAAQDACPAGDAPATMGAYALKSPIATLSVEDGRARLELAFSLHNEGAGPARADVYLPLPEGEAWVREALIDGVATHLDDPGAAEEAMLAYANALELGVLPDDAVDGPHRAALLVAQGGAGAQITVAGPCSRREVRVGLTVEMATRPVDGGWSVEVPRALNDASVELAVVAPGAQVRLDGVPVPHGVVGSVGVVDESDPLATVTVTPVDAHLRARGRVVTVEPRARSAADGGDDEEEDAAPPAAVVIARAELDLPRPLTDASAGLRIVFVVDTSVSVTGDGLSKEWAVMRGILDAAPPDARWSAVSMGRRPRVLAPPWQQRRAAVAPPGDVENGSDLPAALKLARGIARDVDPEHEVGRIIVLSDAKLAFADDDATLVRAFQGAPLTHVVVMPEDARPEDVMWWSRAYVDNDVRAAGPESTGGIWIDASGGDDEEAALYPNLIRPTRLDRPRVMLAGHDVVDEALTVDLRASPRDNDNDAAGAHGEPLFLVEGSGLRLTASLPLGTPTEGLVVEGLLWATPLREEASRLDDARLGVAAVNAVGDALPDDLLRGLAWTTGAVTRVSSLVDVPSWRPAWEVPGGWGISRCGCCCSCCGTRGGTVCRMGVTTSKDLKERETLAALLADDLARCGVARDVVEIEVGDLEILDVTAGSSCVAEAAWGHRLDRTPREPGAFVAHQRITVEVDARAAR